MDDLAFDRSSAGDALAAWNSAAGQTISYERFELGREAEIRRQLLPFPIRPEDERQVGGAQLCGGFDERVEHGLQVEGRAADDLQHIAGRGLVFERFLQIA